MAASWKTSASVFISGWRLLTPVRCRMSSRTCPAGFVGVHQFEKFFQLLGDVVGRAACQAFLDQTLGFAIVLAVSGQGRGAAVEDGSRRLVIQGVLQQLRSLALVFER